MPACRCNRSIDQTDVNVEIVTALGYFWREYSDDESLKNYYYRCFPTMYHNTDAIFPVNMGYPYNRDRWQSYFKLPLH